MVTGRRHRGGKTFDIFKPTAAWEDIGEISDGMREDVRPVIASVEHDAPAGLRKLFMNLWPGCAISTACVGTACQLLPFHPCQAKFAQLDVKSKARSLVVAQVRPANLSGASL